MNLDGCRGSMPFGDLLRGRRKAAGLTQLELARRAGVSVAAIRDLEQGRRHGPRPQSLAGLSRALGLDSEQAVALARAARDPGPPGGRGPGDRRPGDHGPGDHGPGDHGPGRPVSALRLQVLGPLTALRSGQQVQLGPPQQKALLGLLAVQPGTAVGRETIIDALWGTRPPATAVNLVQTYVSRLRGKLAAGRRPASRSRPGALALASDGLSYSLQAQADELDLLAFRQQAQRAEAAMAAGDLPAAQRDFARAIGLWRDVPLARLTTLRDHPAVLEVGRERLEAVLGYADVCARLGEPGRAVRQLRQITASEPLHEPAHARLMIALAASGEQAGALAVYQEVRGRLDAELGVLPGRELSGAHQRVLSQAVEHPRTAPARNGGPARGRFPALAPAPGPVRAAKVTPQQLPATVPYFAGRAPELQALTSMLAESGRSRRAVISAVGGTAGIGKTTLAIHWAHENAHRFRDGQLYVNLHGFDPAGEPMSPGQAIRGFLDALGVPAEQVPTELDAQAALYRSLLARKQVLVVLDNARDEEQVRPLLPGGPACMAVITSRRRLSGLVAGGATAITLSTLGTADARRLLASRIGAARVAAEQDAADLIIDMCAGLPLGLSILAAHAAIRPTMTVSALAGELRDERHRLDALETGDPATTVRAAFACSYRDLTAAEAGMFRLMGIHPGPDISAQAAASLAGVPPPQAARLLLGLTSANLVSELSPGRFALHDLMRVYAREQAAGTDSAGDQRAALRRVLDHYLHTADTAEFTLRPERDPLALAPAARGVTPEDPSGEQQARTWFAAEHRVLIAAVMMAASQGFDVHTWQLAWRLGSYLDWQGYWPDWISTQNLALAATRRLGDLTGQARVYWELGRAFVRLSAFADAKAHMSQALSIYQEIGDPAGQAESLYGLSEAWGREGVMLAPEARARAAGCYEAALAYGRQAFSRFRAVGRGLGQAKALNGLGWTYALAGRYWLALTHCQQALTMLTRPGDPASRAACLDSLGYIYSHLGHYERAVSCYQEAIGLFRQLGHHHEAEVLTHLGDAHRAVGRDRAARAAWCQALHILRRVHRPDTGKIRARIRELPSPPG